MLNREFNRKNFVVLACKAAMPFAERVMGKLNMMLQEKDQKIELGILKTSIFPGGEPRAELGVSIRKKSVHLFQCFRHVDDAPWLCFDVMELMVVLDLLKRSGAAETILYVPFLPFQRQEKKKTGREPISAKMIFDLVQVAAGEKYERLVTADMHTDAGAGFANVSVDNLISWPLFALYIQQILRLPANKIVIVSPDAGGAARAKSFASALNTSYAIINKERDAKGQTKAWELIGKTDGKYAVIIDDIISTGGSIIESQELLLGKEGNAEGIYAFATHGLFCLDKKRIPAEGRFYDAQIQVVATDSIPEKHPTYYSSCYKWLKGVLSLTQYFADALYCNETGKSLSEKMDEYGRQVRENAGNIKDFLIPNQPEIAKV